MLLPQKMDFYISIYHGHYLLIEQEMRVQESPQIILKGKLWEVQLLSKTRDGNLGDRKVFKTRVSGVGRGVGKSLLKKLSSHTWSR